MSARELVRCARLGLGAAAIAAALLWSAATFLGTLALAALADWGMMLTAPVRAAVVPLGSAAAVLAFALVLWRARRVRSAGAVALWLEELAPSLRYTLVTAAETLAEEQVPELERAAAAADLTTPAVRAIARALAVPLGVLAAAALLLVLLPAGAVARVRAPAPGEPREDAAPPPAFADRLKPLVAMVTPPAYAGLPARSLEDPPGVAALVASRVVVSGRGAPRGITARLGDGALDVAAEGDGARWRVGFAMPARAAALRLADGARVRLLILEAVPDSAPVVTLLTPARDTVVRTPSGTIGITADARDDFGLADAWLEYIVSSGEGETFTFRSGVLGRTDAHGGRAASLRATLSLEALALRPGDLVHLRAVARDLNDASGPDSGVSETRTIRVLRRGEYDSVAVEGAPPPDADKSVISERMLILVAEDLQRRRPQLARGVVLTESVHIGREQARLRKQVSRVIFARLGASAESEESQALDDSAPPKTPEEMLRAADAATNAGTGALDFEGDETPVVAVNRTLLEAYNAMWDAERRLQVGEPGDALPYMRSALAAIQRARAAERLYLRGKPPDAVLDLAKVRLAGRRDEASGSARAARAPTDSSAERRVRRLDAALGLLASNTSAGVDSLLLLRVDAIEQDPALATALGAAIEALRAGRDATLPLARARRAAAGAPVAERDGTRWEGAW